MKVCSGCDRPLTGTANLCRTCQRRLLPKHYGHASAGYTLCGLLSGRQMIVWTRDTRSVDCRRCRTLLSRA